MTHSTALPHFPPTRWSLIQRLEGPEAEAERAIGELCETYWRPLYCFARQRGKSSADAQDATQGFLMHALKQNLFGRAQADRGKLRTFLLHAFKHWMLNEQAKERSIVNGGGYQFVSRDEPVMAERCFAELSENETPETLFDRVWALMLLDRVLQRLEKKWQAEGKGEWFETLRPFLDGGRNGDESYEEAGLRLKVPGDRVRVAAFRLRRSYREELIREVRETVSPAEEEEELNTLIQAVSRR